MARHAPDEAMLTVRVVLKPNAREAAVRTDGTTLRVSVKSPPVEGRANAEATALIARAFGVPRSSVRLVRGARGRQKRFEVHGPARLPAGFARGASG